MSSYPRQSFLYRDHILLHHHHQLDTLFITHGDFTGHKTNIITCQVEIRDVSWSDRTKQTALILSRRIITLISFVCAVLWTYLLKSDASLLSATFENSAKKTCFFSFRPIFLHGATIKFDLVKTASPQN